MSDNEYKTVILDGDELEGEFTREESGWFAVEVNGIEWDYDLYGAQNAKETAQEAAEALWSAVTRHGYQEDDGRWIEGTEA